MLLVLAKLGTLLALAVVPSLGAPTARIQRTSLTPPKCGSEELMNCAVEFDVSVSGNDVTLEPVQSGSNCYSGSGTLKSSTSMEGTFPGTVKFTAHRSTKGDRIDVSLSALLMRTKCTATFAVESGSLLGVGTAETFCDGMNPAFNNCDLLGMALNAASMGTLPTPSGLKESAVAPKAGTGMSRSTWGGKDITRSAALKVTVLGQADKTDEVIKSSDNLQLAYEGRFSSSASSGDKEKGSKVAAKGDVLVAHASSSSFRSYIYEERYEAIALWISPSSNVDLTSHYRSEIAAALAKHGTYASASASGKAAWEALVQRLGDVVLTKITYGQAVHTTGSVEECFTSTEVEGGWSQYVAGVKTFVAELVGGADEDEASDAAVKEEEGNGGEGALKAVSTAKSFRESVKVATSGMPCADQNGRTYDSLDKCKAVIGYDTVAGSAFSAGFEVTPLYQFVGSDARVSYEAATNAVWDAEVEASPSGSPIVDKCSGTGVMVPSAALAAFALLTAVLA